MTETQTPTSGVTNAEQIDAFAAALEVPLTFQGEPIGTLVVGPRAGEVFTSADHRLLEQLARHAAPSSTPPG